MKRILLVCAFCLAVGVVAAQAEVVDKIAVVVNGEIITYGEVDRLLIPVYAQFRTRYAPAELAQKMEEMRGKVIDQLIDEKLMLCEAKKTTIEVADKEIEARVDEAAKQFPSRREFERQLMAQRMTLKDLKTRFKEQIMVRKFIDQKFGGKVAVTPAAINSFYQEHIDRFTQPAEAKLRSILIRPKEGEEPAAARARAEEVEAKLKGGADFAELARTYSEGPGAAEGGLMGAVRMGDLLPDIEKAVFALKPGEISGIIESPLGYHIFKVEEMREAKVLPLNDVRRVIEESIYQEKTREKMKVWVAGLKKNAYIAYK